MVTNQSEEQKIKNNKEHKAHKPSSHTNNKKHGEHDFFEILNQTTETIKEFADANPDNPYVEKVTHILDILHKIKNVAPSLLIDKDIRKMINEKLDALDIELLNEIKKIDSSNVESVLHKITLDGTLFTSIEQIYHSIVDTLEDTINKPKNKSKARNIFYKIIRAFHIFSKFSKSPFYKMIFGESPLDNLSLSYAKLHRKYSIITAFYSLISFGLLGKIIFVFYMMYLKNTPITNQTIIYLLPILALLVYVIYLAKINSQRKLHYEKLRATVVDTLKYLDSIEVSYKKGHKEANLEAVKLAVYNKKLDIVDKLINNAITK